MTDHTSGSASARASRGGLRALRSGLGLAAALAVASLAGGARAATICVDPGKAGCQTTIQGGIGAASAGDTLTIAKGFYNENAVVPSGKNGLVIIGPRTVVIDADAPLVGDALTIDSSGVTVAGLTIRNGDADGIVANGTNVLIDGVTLTGLDGDCIVVNGQGGIVQGSTLRGCGDNAIQANSADDLQLLGNRISHCDETCIEVVGDDAIIEKNTVSMAQDDHAILVAGNNVEIVGNRLDGASAELVSVAGDNALVSGNRLANAGGGVAVAGANPVVAKNAAESLGGGGWAVDVTCTGSCGNALVESNRVKDAADDTGGISVTGNAAGMVVRKNRVERTEDFGFQVNGGAPVDFQSNAATTVGGDRSTACIDVNGAGGHAIARNRGTDCHGDGIDVSGTGHTLTRNQVRSAIQNGLHLSSGSGHTVDANKVQDANGAGLAVESAVTSSSADGNSVKRVRNGLCNKSVSTTVTNHTAKQTDTADEIGGGGSCPI